MKLMKRQLQLTHKAKSRSEGDMRVLCAVMSCHIVTELTKEVPELRKQVAERPQESSGEAATEAVAAVEGLRAEKDAALHQLSTLQSTMNTLQQVCTIWHYSSVCVYMRVCVCVCVYVCARALCVRSCVSMSAYMHV